MIMVQCKIFNRLKFNVELISSGNLNQGFRPGQCDLPGQINEYLEHLRPG